MKPKTIPLYKLIYYIGPALLLAGLLLWLCGCTKASMTFKDGRVFKYESNLFDKKFNEMIFYPDGSFAITGYQSDLQSMILLAEKLAARIPVTAVP